MKGHTHGEGTSFVLSLVTTSLPVWQIIVGLLAG